MASFLCRKGFRNSLALCRKLKHYREKRTLLSSAYSSSDAWNQRLQTPVLQRVDVSDFALKLQHKFDLEGRGSAIDIDILANKLEHIDPIQLDFVQNLFYRFRHTKAAVHAQESTSHALVRALIKFNELDRLMEMLQDKMHYGIFLDYFTANILLDMFLEKGNYQDAARIAIDMMLQEDFAHPVTAYLSWLACHLQWKTPPTEGATEPQEQPPEEEEEDWIKVDFIKNVWYDDHWDIATQSQQIGKTFVMIAQLQDVDSLLSRSYQLIGWGLYQKFDKGLELIKQWADTQMAEAVAKEAVAAFGECLQQVETKEPPEPKEPGLVTITDVSPYITQEQKELYLQQFQELHSQIKDQNQVVDFDLETSLRDKTKDIILHCESKDISDQETIFQKWNSDRQELLDKQVQDYLVEKRKVEIAMKLKELKEREEKLRYFEQQDKISLGIQRAPRMKPIEQAKEEELFVGAPGERGRKI